MSTKPSCLILGGISNGVAFALLSHIKRNCQFEHIRLSDKFLILPQADAYLTFVNPDFRKLLKDGSAEGNISYTQSNLALGESRKKIFTYKNGSFDYVFDLTGETDFAANELQHVEKTAKLAAALGKTAASFKVKAYIRKLSYCFDVPDNKKGHALEENNAAAQPFSILSKWDYEAARALADIPDLNLVIVRPAMLYGPFIVNEFTGRLLVAEIYRYMGEQMDMLWSKEIVNNSVHSADFAAACWALAQAMQEWGRNKGDALAGSPLPPCRPLAKNAKWLSSSSYKPTKLDKEELDTLCKRTKTVTAPLFNIVDKGNTTVGSMTEIIANAVGVKAGFANMVINQFAKMNLDTVQEEANEILLESWPNMLSDSNISQPIFNPVVPRELLSKHSLALDGKKLKQHVGNFQFQHPAMTAEEVNRILAAWRSCEGTWPNAVKK